MTLEKYFSQVTVVEHKNGVKEAVVCEGIAMRKYWLKKKLACEETFPCSQCSKVLRCVDEAKKADAPT